MAWFLNKETGVKWEVTNEDHVKRCTNDENYEEIDAPEVEDQTEINEFKKQYTVDELKVMLTEKGIEYPSKATKDDLIDLLFAEK